MAQWPELTPGRPAAFIPDVGASQADVSPAERGDVLCHLLVERLFLARETVERSGEIARIPQDHGRDQQVTCLSSKLQPHTHDDNGDKR